MTVSNLSELNLALPCKLDLNHRCQTNIAIVFDYGESLSDKLMLAYEPHECSIELEQDKIFLDRSFNHIRLKFKLSKNIELDLTRPADEEEDYGVSLTFNHYGREGEAPVISPVASPIKRFSPEAITAV
jgi:hypothetical protein